jgi:hypothetical protein
MNYWNKCRNYGHLVINQTNNSIRLYYNRFEFRLATNPRHFTVESAQWQGNNLLLRGRDARGTNKSLIMDDFNSYQII